MNTDERPTHWFSVILFLLVGYCVIFAESRMTGVRQLIGTQIDLLPGMLVYAAVSFNVGVVISSATILGLLFDSMSTNALGTSSVAFLLTTFSLFYFRELLLQDQITAQFVLGAIASAAVPFLALLIIVAAGQTPLIGAGSLAQWLLMTAGGAAFTPLWFLLFNRLDRSLRYKEVSDPSFRPDRQIARGKFMKV